MTMHDLNDRNEGDLPDALRWQLRALRRDTPPERDLWPEIATRLTTQSRIATRARHWPVAVALAATLLLVLGTTLLLPGMRPPGAAAPKASLVQREANGMTRQYQAALQELGSVPPPPSLKSAFDDLDRNAALILDALSQDPDSRLLLEQLHRTYARRLALTQRLVYT